MLSKDLRSEVNKLWDKFWSGGIANPITAIEQISYLLFIRRLDEIDTRKLRKSTFTGEDYQTIFRYQEKYNRLRGVTSILDDFRKENITEAEQTENLTQYFQNLRWTNFKEMSPNEMLSHVRDEVFPFIKLLNDPSEPFTQHMENAVFIIPKPTLLSEAVKTIENIMNILETQEDSGQGFQDTQGDIYEYLLNEISSAGKNGQFRTPRHIIQLVCGLLNPDVTDRVCDPACGTGGFLLGAYQHILTKYTSEQYLKIDEHHQLKRGVKADRLTDERLIKKLNTDTFYGYDFDTTMVRVGLMNLMMHGIEQPQLDYQDSLSKRFEDFNKYTMVLANPPFKGSIDKGDVNAKLKIGTTKTELLFVEQIINMLTLGGKAGIIIPDGVLFGSSKAHKALRKRLLYQCQLDMVVSLPSGVFKPYAGVSTAIICFTKTSERHDEKRLHTEKVWFYDMENDGYSLDDKRNEINGSEIAHIINSQLQPNPDGNKKKYFFIPADEIKNNGFDLSINRYKDIEYEEVQYDPPLEIIATLEKYEEEIHNYLAQIKALVKE